MNEIRGVTDSITFAMDRVSSEYKTMANAKLRARLGVSIEELGALIALSSLGEINQQQLADSLLRNRSSTKRLVDNCVQKALINRSNSSSNLKNVMLSLTEDGQLAVQTGNDIMRDIKDDLYQNITEHEMKIVRKVCEKMLIKMR
ncbi:MarR family winged helix-turn-helix transcriptional regulator [Vibrio hippocampi]|uniref:HTH marR-type domain-containing protein n=1 Tax=Vibrio hippocampi TaxID=654686 RepID=A0ABN8DMX9_9VIBR|nr:MarR family transcriptional regulator [Vibrio hippocampi]CAH0529801.1 hypothetical protein VHP8226_03557 [Vibrio hippocampi]